MSQRIPERLDPWRYADLAKILSGTMRLDAFPRLGRCLLDAGGDVVFELRFERDAERRATMTGTISAELALECQRCLETVSVPVATRVAIAFVESIEQADRLPETLDPCLVEEGRVSLPELIEDELLLLLPQVAVHREGACPTRLADHCDAPMEEEAGNNPFAVLAGLKREK